MPFALKGGMKHIFYFRHPACWLIFMGFGLLYTAASALQIRDYEASRHDRFTTGYPDAPVVNTNWLGVAYDFSGVGWDDSRPVRSITLISPQHFVGAWHSRVAVGGSVSFLNRLGERLSVEVAARFNITNGMGEVTDLYVGELARAIEPCDHIAFGRQHFARRQCI